MKINCNIDSQYIKYIDELILLATSRKELTFNEVRQEVNIDITIFEHSISCLISTPSKTIICTEQDDELKLMLKRCVFKGLSQILDRPLSPWGILTGVRPTKVVQGFANDGLRKYEIERELEDNYLVSQQKIEILFRIRAEQDALWKGLTDTLHLYIGIPFCPSRCSYCSFTSYTTDKSESMIAPYLKGLLEEIEFWGEYIKEKNIKLSSIYIGGGTPSSLTVNQIEELLLAISRNFSIPALLEYTFEGGRPDTLSREKLEVIKRHGVTRLSINPQTMNNQTLASIGRTHTKEDFIKVFKEARDIGFNWINTDLIIGLEQEGYTEYRKSVTEIAALRPENITIHSLALKRAAIQKGKSLLDYAEAKKIMDFTYSVMDNNGYAPYYLYRQKSMAGNQENVGFTKSGYASPYNVVSIEENASVIALGCGAISKIVSNNEIIRHANPKDPNQYLSKRTQGDGSFVSFLNKLEEYLDTDE